MMDVKEEVEEKEEQKVKGNSQLYIFKMRAFTVCALAE